MRKNNKFKSVLSMILTICMLATFVPNVFAAQSNEYVDPADSWLSSNNRTNELDVNATTTYETQYCAVCDKTTTVLTYRVPEYTKSGETALNRGVMFSNGTLIDGDGTGNLDDGTPGIDAYYTGYHWTKVCCQTCGTINPTVGHTNYGFNNNVYCLNSCDHNFFLEFDNTTHEYYDEDYHITTLKRGEYCKFCKGTFARASIGLEYHDYTESVDAQVGNNRFYIHETCEDCDYETSEYVTAKAVIASYYGVEDGEAHTLTVNDLSDRGVKTSIRYGNTADNCTMTSAPNYTKAGYYTVYYNINYSYDGETMTENGVSYIHLIADEEDEPIIMLPSNNVHEHEFHYLETVKPSCDELGYERFQCLTCGELDKRNYTPATGHDYDEIVIREATCKQGGLVLTLCADCGDFYQKTTPTGEHKYKTVNHNATCKSQGYTEHICEICAYSYITNLTPIISHSYERVTKEPTCEDKGYTTSTCTMCGFNYVSDYTEPIEHSWDEGTQVTSSTCDAEGVIEYTCENCEETMISATDATGHIPGDEATCTEPQLCSDCGTVLEKAIGHSYETEIVEPTCTSMGYTIYNCGACGDTYNSDYTEQTEHNYIEVVTEPTCTSHGYTTYSCEDCDAEYVSDYVEKAEHNHIGVVTAPTCTSMGYTTYTCEDCDDSYVGDYVDMTEHNYNKETVEPTCEEHGYAVYTCPDCGKSYIGDYVDSIEHTYTETVVEPTCTTMGYTIFKCNDCDDEYKDNYKEALGHTPSEWIVDVPATIEGTGSKHIECTVCGETLQSAELPQLIDKDNSDEDGKAEIGDYSIILTDENGKPIFNSELTIDVNDNVSIKLTNGRLLDFEKPTTITAFYTETQKPKENLAIYIEDVNGNKAIGFTNADGQLIVPNNRTNTNDDNGTIGKENGKTKETFVITVTDKANVVIPNCDIYIGESNNVVVDLPEGIKPTRENPVIVTITDHNGEAQADVTVIALGDADFIEKGKTDIYGKITLPTSADGYTDEEGHVNVNELNVLVNDELGAIADAYVKYNDDNTITVTLPDETTITYANRITVTVTDSIGGAVKDKSVTILDVTEKSYTALTDENGKVIVPPVNTDMTDAEGKAKVNGYDVVIYDETKPIENAYIEIVDGIMSVVLPEGVIFDYHNRITAEIKDADGNPVKDIQVNFTDSNKNIESVVSDENGKVIVPPVHRDMTDVNGEANVNGYKVVLADEKAPIANAYIEIVDGKINVKLPEGVVFDYTNRITATVTDSEDKAVKDMSVTFTDAEEKSETNLTDENGKASVPPINMDYTDVNGYSEVDGFIVTVTDEAKPIEKAFITHNAEVKNEDGTVKDAAYITVKLPENVRFDYANRITVAVHNKADNTPVKDMKVVVTETIAEDVVEDTNTEGENSEQTETDEDADDESDTQTEAPVAKTLNGVTDANGKVVFPPLNEDITDNEGNSGVEETKPGEGENTEDVKTAYKVLVADTKGIIGNALVEIKDGKVTVTLPETHTLTTSNQTTVTVTDNEDKAVKGVSVTIVDKTTSKSGTTDANGKVTLPVKSSGGSGGSSSGGGSYSGGGGGGSYVSTSVKIVDKDGKTVSVTRSVTSTKATLTLPTGKNLLKDDNYYTITVTSGSKAKADYPVVLKDKNGNEVAGTTDENGIIILPGKEHKAYIFGYNDGSFRPDNDMTRSEAAAIFARLIAEEKGETVSGKATFSDVPSNDWAYGYIGYLEKYDIIKGYSDGTFRPNDAVTRAEFVTMAVRYYALFNEVKKSDYTVNYTDLTKSYWAYSNIAYAKHIGWLNGYADGTFKGDNNITRAEVVTVTNHATERTPDEDYINKNVSTLNKFTDLKNNSHWAYYSIMEAANTHLGVANADAENWVK